MYTMYDARFGCFIYGFSVISLGVVGNRPSLFEPYPGLWSPEAEDMGKSHTGRARWLVGHPALLLAGKMIGVRSIDSKARLYAKS